MFRFLRNLIIFSIMLWLPLQGVAAAAMPVCQNSADHQPAQIEHPAHHNCDQPDGQPVQKASCDNCALCHLCGTSTVADSLTRLQPYGGAVYAPLTDIAVKSFIPEQPQRPPLADLV